MILQTKAPSLIALMAKESGQGSHLRAVCDAILLARAEAELLPLPNTISNDRTTLPHQK
jgi:hypothetical protein